MMKIAKEFTWNMGHRLPFHNGLCKNPHGHSYKLRIVLYGLPDESGMLLDYAVLKKITNAILCKYDHSFVFDKSDQMMIDFFSKNAFKYVVIPVYSTAENLCNIIAEELIPNIINYRNIKRFSIRISETNDVYAENKFQLNE